MLCVEALVKDLASSIETKELYTGNWRHSAGGFSKEKCTVSQLAGPVTEKMIRVKTVRLDRFWIKNGPAGPFLAD